jgi:oligosaccharyltransferase complex subunit epsilon
MPPKSKPSASTPPTSNAVSSLWNAYVDTTPSRLKFIDSFLAFLVLSGVIQFAYCVLVTNFPFNAFLAGYA